MGKTEERPVEKFLKLYGLIFGENETTQRKEGSAK